MMDIMKPYRSTLCSEAQYRNTQTRCDQAGDEDASAIQPEALSYGSTHRLAHQEAVWSILHPTSSIA